MIRMLKTLSTAHCDQIIIHLFFMSYFCRNSIFTNLNKKQNLGKLRRIKVKIQTAYLIKIIEASNQTKHNDMLGY